MQNLVKRFWWYQGTAWPRKSASTSQNAYKNAYKKAYRCFMSNAGIDEITKMVAYASIPQQDERRRPLWDASAAGLVTKMLKRA